MVRRRLNLSHLSQEECDRILAVIQRDFHLRTRERQRLKKLEEELAEQAELRRERQTNDKSCSLCCAAFNLLFNKRLSCAECEACVCRDCSSYDARNKLWYCRVCDQQRNLRAQSCEWFYENVKMRFNQFGSTKVLLSIYGPKKDGMNFAEEDFDASEQEDIQLHMESVLEGFLGEALDSACVGRMFNHSSYDQLVLDHRVPLHEAVLRFSRSLLVAMQDKPKEPELTPTSAHADLKECVQRLCRDADNLPCLRDLWQENSSRRNSSSAFSDLSDECEDVSFDTYEDLLVMAVINKAVGLGQKKYGLPSSSDGRNKSCEPDVVQTSKKEHIDVGCQSDIPFSDSGQDEEGFTTGETTESDEFFWTRSPKEETFPYIIEEKIEEEITEAYTESEDDPSRTLSDSDDPTPDANVLLALDLTQQNRVPFPEMGVDLVSPNALLTENDDTSNNGDVEESPGVLVASITDWEENWLFRKKQRSAVLAAFRGGRYARYFDPINMLIPNPTTPECVLLGSREVDELSEMSEKFSVGSLELPSLSESEGEAETVSHVQLEPLQRDCLERTVRTEGPDEEATQGSPLSSLPCSLLPPRQTPKRAEIKSGVATHQPTPRSSPKRLTEEVKRLVPNFQPVHERKSPSTLRFLSQPDATTVLHEGKAAKFLCEISSPKILGFAWFRGTERVAKSDKCRFHRLRGKEFLLELYDVCKADEGTYSAVAYSDREQLWCDFSLVVRATARAHNEPGFTVAPHLAEWTGEHCIRISCTVSGYPEPRVSFSHEGLPIPDDNSLERFAVENEGYGEWSLQVQSPTDEDEGDYSVIARNSLGQKVQTVTFRLGDLNVKAVPKSSLKELDPRQPLLMSSHVAPTVTGRKNRALVIQRTWAEREAQLHAAAAHKRENGLSSTQYAELSSLKNVDEETAFVPSVELLNSPPKPGTIAEREHTKWLNAVHLENNPYSAENLARRASLGRKDSLVSSMTHEDSPAEDTFAPPVLPATCARDYYINNPKLLAMVEPPPLRKLANGRSTPSNLEGPEETLHSFEEQMYSTPRKAFSPTFQRQQLRSDSPPPLPETPPPGITKMTASKFETTGRRTPVEEELSLPSVRELVLKFASPSTQSSLDVSSAPESGTPSPVMQFQSTEKSVILEEPNGTGDKPQEQVKYEAWNMNKIHSLTARSLSREFREHAQKNLVPRQMNRLTPSHSATSSLDTVASSSMESRKQPGGGGGDTTPGYASDESSNGSAAGVPVARVVGAKRRPTTSRNLLQRTSYWERRAEQGLLSDSSVTEEFPQDGIQEV